MLFFASLAGVVMTFRNYPGRSGKRRKYMHKLALLVMHEGNSLDVLSGDRKMSEMAP